MAEVTGFRNNALPYPIYGQAWYVVFPLLDADGDPISPSSPDSERSLNGDTFADCTNEATEIATSSGICYLLLTAAEMTADIVTVRIQSTGAKTTVITLYPRKLAVLSSGTCQGANDTGDIQLASGDAAIDDYYNGCLIVAVIDSVTEARIINDYVGSTKVAEISPAWNTAAPDSNDTYTIYLPEGRQVSPVNVTHAAGVAWASGAITAASIATDAIDADAIADNAINAAAIAADAITAAKIADGAIDAATFAAGAINAAAIAADAIGASELAADAVTEIQSGLATAANLATVAGYIDTEVASILAAVDTEVGAIKTVTDQFVFGTANRVNAQVFGIEDAAITNGAFNTDAIDANAVAADAASEIGEAAWNVVLTSAPAGTAGALLQGIALVSGTIGATGNTTTTLHLAGLAYANDAINSMTLVIKDVSTGLFYSRWIEDWDATNDLATVATLPFTPQASTDLYWILPGRSDVTGGSGLDAAGVRAAIGLASANLDTQLDALPTNAELSTALGTADDAVLAAIAALNNLSQANIRTALGMASANFDTQIGDLPTNAELATALGTADDAVLAAIAALNNLSEANIRTAVGLASANLDTQIAALATAANLATLSAYVDTEVAAILAAVDTEIAAIKAKTDNLPTDPADASDIAASFASIASTLSTLAAYVDTEVAAIKAKTDSLTFTVANVLDANIQRVNDVAVAGTGASGDEWGPA